MIYFIVGVLISNFCTILYLIYEANKQKAKIESLGNTLNDWAKAVQEMSILEVSMFNTLKEHEGKIKLNQHDIDDIVNFIIEMSGGKTTSTTTKKSTEETTILPVTKKNDKTKPN